MRRMADTFQSRKTDVENLLKDEEVFSARLSGTSIGGGADMPRKPRFAFPDGKQIRVTAEAKQAAADALLRLLWLVALVNPPAPAGAGHQAGPMIKPGF
jgi:hypothetical protein